MEVLAVHSVSLHEQVGQNHDISNYIKSIFSSDQKIQRWKEEGKQLVKDTLLKGARETYILETFHKHLLAGCRVPSPWVEYERRGF